MYLPVAKLKFAKVQDHLVGELKQWRRDELRTYM